LEKVYQTRYGDRAFVSKAYQERIATLVRAVAQKYGLQQRFGDEPLPGKKPAWPVQAEFWPGAQELRRGA